MWEKKPRYVRVYMLYYFYVTKGGNAKISVCVLIFRKGSTGRIN